MTSSHFKIPFLPTDPFPLLEESTSSQNSILQEEKSHSESVDQWLKIPTHAVEQGLLVQKNLEAPQSTATLNYELWIGRDPQVFSTPYTELRRIITLLQQHTPPCKLVIDCGAGYGRLGIVLASVFPTIPFIGYELLIERIEAVSHLHNVWQESPVLRVLKQVDLADPKFQLPLASHYFIYDFGSESAISACLEKLKLVSQNQSICVVGRGRRVRDLIERLHPWLSQVNTPRHFCRFSFYQS